METTQSPLGTGRETKKPRESNDGSSITGKRVLLAEDNASARKVIAAALRAMGLEVIEVDDGGRMLVAVSSFYKEGRSPEDLDLLITDVHMPVLGGLDVFQGLRAAHWTTPVIVVTGHDTPELRAAVARLGAVLLLKPLDLDILERTVRELLANSARKAQSRALTEAPSSAV